MGENIPGRGNSKDLAAEAKRLEQSEVERGEGVVRTGRDQVRGPGVQAPPCEPQGAFRDLNVTRFVLKSNLWLLRKMDCGEGKV